MPRFKGFNIILFVLFSSFSLIGQSLIEDTGDLLKAVEILKSEGQSDSLITATSLEVLAILYSYDQPDLKGEISIGTVNTLLSRYSDNLFIQGILKDSLLSLPDTISSSLMTQFRHQVAKRRTGVRERMLELLHAKNAISPADYLSVTNTLEQYRTPPKLQTTALKEAASESNRHISNGILTSQAEVIEGIFKFVLKRAQDEVVVSFLEKMLNEDTPNFQSLFPVVVAQFNDRELNYSNSFIQRVRQAFYEDIQLLSIRLPQLLLEDEYFEELQGNPIAYNLLALYSIVGMANKGTAIEEILPVTHRYLYQNYTESSKEVNLLLADAAVGSLEYDKLASTAQLLINDMKVIYQKLGESEVGIDQTINAFQKRFPLAPPPPYVNDYLQKDAYDLEVLLGEANGNEFNLFILPCLLRGELDADCLAGYNTLESYDKFFGLERSHQQWRAAGLELLRRFNGTWYNDESIADILYNWQKDLTTYHMAVDQWMQSVDSLGALQVAIREVERKRVKLDSTIQIEALFWDSIRNDQRLALNLLSNIIQDFEDVNIGTELDAILGADVPEEDVLLGDTLDLDIFDEDSLFVDPLDGLDGLDDINIDDIIGEAISDMPAGLELIKLEKKREKLLGVEQRLFELHKKLTAQNPDNFRASPVRKYQLDTISITPYGVITNRIDLLSDQLAGLNEQFRDIDKKFAFNKSSARENAKPVLQTTEVITKMLYCIRSSNSEQKWLGRAKLDTVLNTGNTKQAFLGLLQQFVSSGKDVGLFSPDALSQLVQLTLSDLSEIPTLNQADSIAVKDSMAFYRKAAFVINTVNRVFELPLITSLDEPGSFQPLIERWPNLKQVPEASKQALDFIYYLNIENHSKAMSTLIRLFTSLDAGITDTKDNKRKPAIVYLKRYGDFIADLIDADDSAQVEDLVSNIADPPGSSQTKRRRQITVGLNAYLGGSVGMETWNGNALLEKDEFFSLAPTMPIGLSISSLFGKKERSYSVFISFLDLGGLLNYRSDNNALGESVFNFKNMFKPGLQIHRNFDKSPFYLGIGGHYGPQIREINGVDTALGSYRFFMSFGVDVPVKTLYQKYK